MLSSNKQRVITDSGNFRTLSAVILMYMQACVRVLVSSQHKRDLILTTSCFKLRTEFASSYSVHEVIDFSFTNMYPCVITYHVSCMLQHQGEKHQAQSDVNLNYIFYL
jgi:hypothetical protein